MSKEFRMNRPTKEIEELKTRFVLIDALTLAVLSGAALALGDIVPNNPIQDLLDDAVRKVSEVLEVN